MAPRYIGLDPTQVIWSNLRIKWWERIIRYTVTVGFIVALIVFWAIPTAVVGAISNINFLTENVPFLAWIDDLPKWIKGAITGLLPTVAMSIWISLVPVIMRFMAKLGGAPSQAAVELTTQNFYFAFQVIQVFLVVTVTSSASSAAGQIVDNPTQAASLLATNLPKSSNFYISYVVLQGLSFSSGALLQIGGLIVGKILGKLLDTTPRKMYTRWSALAGLGWGTVYPAVTLLAVIGKLRSCFTYLTTNHHLANLRQPSHIRASHPWSWGLPRLACTFSISPTATICCTCLMPISTRRVRRMSVLCSISRWAAICWLSA